MADAKVSTPEGPSDERLYVGNGLLRTDSSRPESRVMLLVDYAAGSTLAVVPDLRTAIRFPTSDLYPIPGDAFQTGPDRNPCSKMARAWSCVQGAPAQVGPFATVAWTVTDQRRGTVPVTGVWVDEATHLIVKYTTGGDTPMTTEFIGLKPGHQPDALFALPDGFDVSEVQKP